MKHEIVTWSATYPRRRKPPLRVQVEDLQDRLAKAEARVKELEQRLAEQAASLQKTKDVNRGMGERIKALSMMAEAMQTVAMS